MKKIWMLLIVMFFGMASAYSQVYNVYVSWIDENCDCLGTTSENYFKVTISIYDDANDVFVIQNYTVTTADANDDNINISVNTVETYCGQLHQYTPSFTIYATVWLMENYTNPPVECCTGSDSAGPYSCQEFYDGGTDVTDIQLN